MRNTGELETVTNIKKMFDYLRYYELDFSNFIREVQKIGYLSLFGGKLRDLVLAQRDPSFDEDQDIKKIIYSSDFDLVLECPTQDIYLVLEILGKFGFPYMVNKLGGLRISIGKIRVDLWSLRNTWAIKNNIVQGWKTEHLILTTFFNWDAIAYGLIDEEFYVSHDYFASINSGVLGLNLSRNYNPSKACLRIIKHLLRGGIISKKVIYYLRDHYPLINPNTMNVRTKSPFFDIHIREEDFIQIRNDLEYDLQGYMLPRPRQLELFREEVWTG